MRWWLLPLWRIEENENYWVFKSPTQAKTVLTGLTGDLCCKATSLLGSSYEYSKFIGEICRGEGEAVDGERREREKPAPFPFLSLCCYLPSPSTPSPDRATSRWWSSGEWWQHAPGGSTQVPALSCPILTEISLPNLAENLQPPPHQGTSHIWQWVHVMQRTWDKAVTISRPVRRRSRGGHGESPPVRQGACTFHLKS